jgi:hypothetical protein
VVITTRCWRCTRYRGQLDCDAFPNGIPEAILSGEHDHAEPYQGDQGLTYQPGDPQIEPGLKPREQD